LAVGTIASCSLAISDFASRPRQSLDDNTPIKELP